MPPQRKKRGTTNKSEVAHAIKAAIGVIRNRYRQAGRNQSNGCDTAISKYRAVCQNPYAPLQRMFAPTAAAMIPVIPHRGATRQAAMTKETPSKKYTNRIPPICLVCPVKLILHRVTLVTSKSKPKRMSLRQGQAEENRMLLSISSGKASSNKSRLKRASQPP